MRLLNVGVLAAALTIACVRPSVASWPANGLLISGGPGVQFAPRVVRDGAGGALVCWASQVTDTSGDLLVQRVGGDGAVASGWPVAGRPVVRVPMTAPDAPLYASSYGPTVASDCAAGAFVLWSQAGPSNSVDIRILHIDGLGQIAAGWPAAGRSVIPATSWASYSTMISDGTGGVFVAWCDLQAGDLYTRVQHLGGDGAPLAGWPSSGVAPRPHGSGQYDPVLTLDGTGGVWIGWIDGGGTVSGTSLKSESYQRMVHHVTSSGALDANLPAGGVILGGYDVYASLVLLSDASGGVYGLWNGSNGASQYGDFAQRLTSAGTVAGGWPSLGLAYSTTGVFAEASAIADGQGGVVAAWYAYDQGSTSIRALRMHPDGTVATGWPASGVVVNPARTINDVGLPLPVADGQGGAIVVWADSASDGASIALFAQRVGPDGVVSTVNGQNRLTVCVGSGARGATQLDTDGAGGVFITWVDQRSDQGDVYLTHLSSSAFAAGVPRPSDASARLLLAAPRPNPSSVQVSFSVTLAQPEHVNAWVTDASGRRLRTLADQMPFVAGRHDLGWDGRDQAGRATPTGLYFLVVHAGSRRVSRGFVHLH